MCSLINRLFLSLVLSACLTLPAFAEDPKSAVLDGVDVSLKERVSAYWQARIGRSADVMRFYAPVEKGGPKRSRDVSEFGNVGYKAFEVKDAKENGDFGLVTIEVQTDLRSLPLPAQFREKLKTQTLTEEWLRVDDVWYKKPIPRGFSSKRPPESGENAEAPAGETASKE